MPEYIYTIEELMLDDSFISYCLSTGAAVPSHWRNIIRDNPGQQKTFDEAKKLVLCLHGGLSRPEVNRQIDFVRRKLKERSDAEMETQPAPGPSLSAAFVVTGEGQIKRRVFRTMLSYAGVVCLLVITAWFFFFKSVSHSSGNQPLLAQSLNYQSPVGHRQTISLPDGSTVILNSSSSISLNGDFNKEKREIRLTGDAFFKVAKDAKRPFVVYSDNIATTALGTEFYVHGKKDVTKAIQVDLLEGKVQMADIKKNTTHGAIILFPGESGRSLAGSDFSKRSFDSLYLRSWISGRVSFNETPVLKAFKQLENWYGVEINVRKKGLEKRSIIGSEYQEASLQDILKVICFSINCKYSLVDNKVTIE
jgi:ferric-dicitrate binding protein FerR (iron transport regulator)